MLAPGTANPEDRSAAIYLRAVVVLLAVVVAVVSGCLLVASAAGLPPGAAARRGQGAYAWMPVAGVVAATQMMVFVTVAGAVRPGYDVDRNWVSQLSIGPGGWQGTANLASCGLWLIVCAAGLGSRLGPDGAARWAVLLVRCCGAGLVVLAIVPTDPGLGYPPGVPSVYTAAGAAHQLVSALLGLCAIAAAALLGRCLRDTGVAWARPAGLVVAAGMAVVLVAASVLVVLDADGVLPGTPSGLLERVALFAGLGWIAVVGTALLVTGGAPGSARQPGAAPEAALRDR